jgi:hypothetical protein
MTRIATELSGIKDQARGHEQVLALQQELVGRLVDVVQKRVKEDREVRRDGVQREQRVVEPVPAPDPWRNMRGDAG